MRKASPHFGFRNELGFSKLKNDCWGRSFAPAFLRSFDDFGLPVFNIEFDETCVLKLMLLKKLMQSFYFYLKGLGSLLRPFRKGCGTEVSGWHMKCSLASLVAHPATS